MNGNYYANLFVHFIPIDHDQMNAYDHTDNQIKRNVGGHEGDNHDADNLQQTKGQTDLHVAAAIGNIPQLKILLDRGDIDINSKDSNGWQPLHEAVHSGSLEATKLLISHGADVSSRTNNGGTALWWAKGTFDDSHPVVRYLEEIGAPVDDINDV